MPARPSPSIVVREAHPDEIESLVPLLLLAEPSASALRWSLANLSDAVYRADLAGDLVGAATMRWEGDPCEIVELAVAEARHGQGIGRAVIDWFLDEARRRGKQAVEVGTANASLGNIAFYQKCGFRMERVRKDYFWYQRPPQVENGIVVRDLLVFRHALADEPLPARRRGGRPARP